MSTVITVSLTECYSFFVIFTGSYGYTDAYGIYRTVEYVADKHGT